MRSSSISGEMYGVEKSARGSADSVSITASKKRRSSLGAKMVAIVGLSQWSRSTLQLNQSGEHSWVPVALQWAPAPLWLKHPEKLMCGKGQSSDVRLWEILKCFKRLCRRRRREKGSV